MPFNAVFSWLIGKRQFRIDTYRDFPIESQNKVFDFLLNNSEDTEFSKTYQINKSLNVQQFQQKVPLQDYGTLKPWIDGWSGIT